MRIGRNGAGRAAIVAAAAALVTLAGAAGAADSDRALRNVVGEVTWVRSEAVADGGVWVYAGVREDGAASPLALRIGPADLVAANGFEVRSGDRVQVRIFLGEQPYDVQRMRNARTGSVLRVRCLNGEMVWTGPGRHGGRPPGAGGHGGGSTPRPSSPRHP